ncbi:thioesterase II family protein [Streptomyces sp. NBC_00667]|uniref:thioesterase II family protein n=1 Tax=Streptomyces sp. NBC_00667 TaxID=2975803 RepID=UPI002E30DECC|nr:alpha/beta fold hydrolase [Streptomyces sp. NBC_00667]
MAATLSAGCKFVALAPRPAAALRLCCLPPAGAGPVFYQSWTRYLPDTVELCSVELPGRGTRAGRPSCTDMGVVVSGIAEAVSDQSDSRSMVLFGHSVGALLAYEVTRALRREGQRLPKMLALSGMPAAHLGAYPAAVYHVLAAGREGLSDLFGPVPKRLIRSPRLGAAAMAPLLADCLLEVQYRHREESPLDVPLALYGGADDTFAPTEAVRAWNALVTSPADLRLFPGGHAYLRERPGDLVDQLVRDIDALVSPSAVALPKTTQQPQPPSV